MRTTARRPPGSALRSAGGSSPKPARCVPIRESNGSEVVLANLSGPGPRPGPGRGSSSRSLKAACQSVWPRWPVWRPARGHTRHRRDLVHEGSGPFESRVCGSSLRGFRASFDRIDRPVQGLKSPPQNCQPSAAMPKSPPPESRTRRRCPGPSSASYAVGS